MAYIGNIFALGIFLLISMVFLSNRYYLTKASKYYLVCLIITLFSAAINTVRIITIEGQMLPAWATNLIATLDFILMIATMASLSLYLICKIIEHINSGKSFFLAKIAIISISSLAILYILLNLAFGHIFTVSDDGVYQNSPLFYLIYLFTLPQIFIVVFDCIKHRKRLSKSVRVALIELIPALIFCFVLKLTHNDISIFMLAVSFTEMVFYLNFLNHRMGVNTLTMLNDGRTFFTEVSRKIKTATPFKAYLIKITNLGIIKQNYGHRAGDEILYLFAFSLEKRFPDAIAFHMYGTTFALVLPYNEDESAKQTEALISLLDKKINYMLHNLELEYIVAEHVWQDEANADTINEKLEYATQIAKETKQKHINCSLDLEVTRLRQKYLINRMQSITALEGFEIWFQPIYSIRKKSFSSMEVLLRLKEKNGTFISPAEFIPLAEKTGQIVPITWFVIKETCRVLSENPALEGIRASINLPMLQLVDTEFEENLNKIVDGYGIPHDRISFEFTERVILDDLDLAEKNMRHLAKSGYTFYLDDFGVGYSNFNCVLRLPLKTVKLDMSLTSTAEKLKENYGLVYVLTDLFHDMGLNVVAEGAETQEQVDLLRAYGVDGIQGYFYAKPMPLTRLLPFLKNNKNKEK